MDGLAKGTSALAMDDAHFAESPIPACGKIFLQKAGDFSRLKGMQVQLVGDGDANGFGFLGHIQGWIQLTASRAAARIFR
jgi:hypothetical protein